MRETTEAQQKQAIQYLSFAVAGTDYGVPILKVKEILQHEEITQVPGTPPSIRGVINVRGAVVPVVDPAVKFGRPASTPTRLTCVLVVEVATSEGGLTLGVLADAVNEVVDLRPADVEPPPTFGPGVGKVGKGFVLLLDLDRVLTASEADLVAEAAAFEPAGSSQLEADSAAAS